MSEQRSALIVDDEHDIRELLVVTLGRMGLRTDTAPNLAVAREMLSTVAYDLCLTDMRLPDGSGLDLVSEIATRFPTTPVAVITAYGNIRETAFRPWQSDNIPRRYCSADVMVSDGKLRPVHFSIIEDGGFAGFGQGVEWCVVGLDRNWAYNPACKAARP